MYYRRLIETNLYERYFLRKSFNLKRIGQLNQLDFHANNHFGVQKCIRQKKNKKNINEKMEDIATRERY